MSISPSKFVEVTAGVGAAAPLETESALAAAEAGAAAGAIAGAQAGQAAGVTAGQEAAQNAVEGVVFDKLDRDGANSEPALLPNIGAADVELELVPVEAFSAKAFKTLDAGDAEAIERPGNERTLQYLVLDAADYGVVMDDFDPLVALKNTSEINACIAYIGERGGGELLLPFGDMWTLGSIDNKYPGVLVRGYMPSRFHDAGVPEFGTTIRPLSADPVLKHRTPFASEVGVPASTLAKNTGGGFVNLRIIGNGIALRLLEVGSVSSATYDLYLQDAVGDAAAVFEPGISGVDLGEACDIQSSSIHLSVRQFQPGAAQNAHCVKLMASVNANVSLNTDIVVYAQHVNGHALFIQGADNNEIFVSATRGGSGTGKTVQAGDAADYNPNIGGNTFTHLTGNGGCNLLGTDTPGAIANTNTVLNYDNGNGSPPLTAGTGSYWNKVTDTFGVSSGIAYDRIAVGEGAGNALAARTGLGSESLRIVNGSNNHVRLANGTQEWGLNIDPTTGNVRFVRVSGAGKFQVVGDLTASNADFAIIDSANGLNIKVASVVESQIYRSSVGEIAVKTNANNPGSEHYFAFRPDGDFSIITGGLSIGGNRVVSDRGAAVANATDAASAITQLNALLARVRAHGLIAP